ncbi:hypothetical protein Pyn_19041 [Prunus yedoensis var. nudiflora]|uniref:Uncharacterized protein n=1 Tax=Prunus yedoensis var. nudiflora TaxID=2094558 RepID=A0A315B1B5_PRUYE|nr:hypothetical protein Pyn_19041 [Prunus yedoensis var. nudiflora]
MERIKNALNAPSNHLVTSVLLGLLKEVICDGAPTTPGLPQLGSDDRRPQANESQMHTLGDFGRGFALPSLLDWIGSGEIIQTSSSDHDDHILATHVICGRVGGVPGLIRLAMWHPI